MGVTPPVTILGTAPMYDLTKRAAAETQLKGASQKRCPRGLETGKMALARTLQRGVMRRGHNL
jgi:hypothetical protein